MEQIENKTKFVLGPIQTKWLESLEQHPERQMKQVLGRKTEDGSYKACCLGELGLIAGVCNWDGSVLTSIVNGHANTAGLLNYEELGLYSELGKAKEKQYVALAELNDTGNTWPEIAEIIRKYPEAYLTKSI